MKFTIPVIKKLYEQLEKDVKIMPLEEFRKKYLGKRGLLKGVMAQIKGIPDEQRPLFGKEANILKRMAEEYLNQRVEIAQSRTPIDLTAPFETNSNKQERPSSLRTLGHKNPLSQDQVLL